MKRAFTLAEVLVVVAILGVVAAISISSVMKNVRTRETVLKVKKVYSLLTNAYETYLITNPQIRPQPYSAQGATNVANIFLQSVQVRYDVGTSPAEKRKYMHTGNYANKDGRDGYNIYISRNSYYLVVLKDGSHLWFKGIEGHANRNDGVASDIFYDVNGRKGPNRRGYDMFAFNIVGNQIVPCGAHPTYDPFDTHCSGRNDDGWGCAAWIIKNGNMDYLKCDGLRYDVDKSCP